MISLWLIVLWEFEESSHCPYRIHVDLGIREFTSNTPTHMRAHTQRQTYGKVPGRIYFVQMDF